MSGDGGRDEAHECDSSYQGSPNFSDSNGAEGAGDAGDYHGDDKEEGHDRDGSDEAGDGHRTGTRTSALATSSTRRIASCCCCTVAFVACLLVRTGETSGCIHVPLIS